MKSVTTNLSNIMKNINS
ncbi:MULTISPECIES: hypothetical protein [Bacillaceae]